MKRTVTIFGALLISGLVAFGFCARASSVKFVDLGDARSRLVGAGFYCTPDKADGSVATGFVVSREPTTWSEAGALCKVGAMGPEWQGKAWVAIRSPLFKQQTLPDNAGLRNWGKVYAFGDEALLRDLDGLLE